MKCGVSEVTVPRTSEHRAPILQYFSDHCVFALLFICDYFGLIEMG